MTRVAVVGATGRLGSQIVRVIENMPDFDCVAQLGSGSSLAELAGADLVVDATRHDVSGRVIDTALRNGQKVLVGTSGWSTAAIEAAGLHNAEGLVIVPNFSLGSMVATHCAGIVARFFPDAHIDETHHLSKVDAPSGTSTHTAEVIAANRIGNGSEVVADGDHSVAGVSITSHRLSDVIAEQVVTFTGVGEVVTVGHETLDRVSYDAGIAASLRYARTATGLTLGLDRVMGL